MSAAVFQPIAPRPAPVRTEGCVPWVRSQPVRRLEERADDGRR